MNHARIPAYNSLVYLSISDICGPDKFYSMKSIKEKFREEQKISDCICYCAPEDRVSVLSHGVKSRELFLDVVRGSRNLRQMSM